MTDPTHPSPPSPPSHAADPSLTADPSRAADPSLTADPSRAADPSLTARASARRKHRVLLFAQLAERVGAREVDVELPDGATVGDALAALARDHACVAEFASRLAVAVDERYAPPSAVVPPRGILALIPPVSGG